MHPSTDKYNPDVIKKYETFVHTRPANFDVSDRVWKGLTPGKEVPKDEPSGQDIRKRLDDELSKRNKERTFVKRKNHEKLDAYEDAQDKEISDFAGLKKAVITDNDRLQKEKETYNKILEDLNNIF